MDSCPLVNGEFTATPTSHGLSGQAWYLQPVSSGKLVVKFVTEAEGQSSIVAAQIAHQLAVPTPRALFVTNEDGLDGCPALFDVDSLADDNNGEFVAYMQKQQSTTALFQEYVSARTEVLNTTVRAQDPKEEQYRKRPWIQVGVIAAFDWLIGKDDLFNDWMETTSKGYEQKPQNKHNIICLSNQGKAVDIDIHIGLGQLNYAEDLEALMSFIISGKSVSWLSTNVFGVLERSATFGHKYAASADSEVTLGLAYGFKMILGNLEWIVEKLNSATLFQAKASFDALRIMQGSNTSGASQISKISTRISELENYINKQKPKCCKAQCGYKAYMIGTEYLCEGGHHQGVFYTPKPEIGCTLHFQTMGAHVVGLNCASICKENRKVFIHKVTTESCPE